MIKYPNISPDIIRLGDHFAIRWYSMMYLLGYIIGHWIFKKRVQRGLFRIPMSAVDSFISYLVIGMLIGARVFYVLFYNLDYYLENPGDMLMLWKGGLSFHGAAVGMVVACYLFSRRFNVRFFEVTDAFAIAPGPGIFLGRIGNFINGELYGRPSDVPWAMVFPGDPKELPRHPSQLYQGLTEGLLLWFFLNYLQKRLLDKKKYRDGIIGASFLIGYGIIRFFVEFTREPDSQLGYFFGFITMGQILCFAMILIGVYCLRLSMKNPIREAKVAN